MSLHYKRPHLHCVDLVTACMIYDESVVLLKLYETNVILVFAFVPGT